MQKKNQTSFISKFFKLASKIIIFPILIFCTISIIKTIFFCLYINDHKYILSIIYFFYLFCFLKLWYIKLSCLIYLKYLYYKKLYRSFIFYYKLAFKQFIYRSYNYIFFWKKSYYRTRNFKLIFKYYYVKVIGTWNSLVGFGNRRIYRTYFKPVKRIISLITGHIFKPKFNWRLLKFYLTLFFCIIYIEQFRSLIDSAFFFFTFLIKNVLYYDPYFPLTLLFFYIKYFHFKKVFSKNLLKGLMNYTKVVCHWFIWRDVFKMQLESFQVYRRLFILSHIELFRKWCTKTFFYYSQKQKKFILLHNFFFTKYYQRLFYNKLLIRRVQIILLKWKHFNNFLLKKKKTHKLNNKNNN